MGVCDFSIQMDKKYWYQLTRYRGNIEGPKLALVIDTTIATSKKNYANVEKPGIDENMESKGQSTPNGNRIIRCRGC